MRTLPLFLLLAACGDAAPPPTAESCAAICEASKSKDPTAPAPAPAPAAKPAPSGGASLSAWEQEQLGPLLEDLRSGVRPYDDEGVGLCKGTDSCDRYLGLEATELPKGDYILQAVLAVPEQGGPWSVELSTECITTKGDNESSKQSSKSYELSYPGPDRGYSLVPLRRITSPGTYGAQSCTWTLTAPHPDGDKVIEGAWSVPG